MVSVLSDPLVLLDIISGPETRAGRKVAGEMRVEKERERNFRRHETRGGKVVVRKGRTTQKWGGAGSDENVATAGLTGSKEPFLPPSKVQPPNEHLLLLPL